MSGLIHLSERAVERAIQQLIKGDSTQEIARSLSPDQFEELLALLWFGQSPNANLGFAWHRKHYQLPLHGQVNLSASSLRRGLFRLRAETTLVYSAA
ncbi:MAG: hypothetical protein AB8C95_12755 [Phycisphaeraceae bacterium]